MFLKKWTIGLSVLLLLVIGYICASLLVGMDGKKSAEEEAIAIATNQGKLVSISDYYLYHGKEVYSVVVGKDEDGTEQVLWIPEDVSEKSVIKDEYANGVSEAEITNIVKNEHQPKEIISVKLGMESDIPIWEVTYKNENDGLNYVYYLFENGEQTSFYSNI